MNGVCIHILWRQLWTVFLMTTWGVSSEGCLHRQLEESAMKGVCIDNLMSQLWTVFIQFVLTTWGVSYERCLHWQLEESAMNGVYIDNLSSQLWTMFAWTTWGVSYERYLYGQHQEPAMNGVCMDTNLFVITNTDWLIDWWLLSAQDMREGRTTGAILVDCHWKIMMSRVWTHSKTFYCHYNALSLFAKPTTKVPNVHEVKHSQKLSSLWFVVDVCI